MNRKLILFIVSLFLLVNTSMTYAQTNANPYNPLVITHNDIERSAHIYEPDTDITAIMMALHPFYSSGRAMEAMSSLNTIADERGWVIIYPEASQPYWDDGRFSAGLPPLNSAVDDVGYLANLAETARETYDVHDVYLTGLGNGGTMALRAVCETPEQYNGVAIVSALMWTYQQEYCDTDSATAMDMLFIKGTDDHIYWSEGREINNAQWEIMSIEDTLSFWSSHHQCDEARPTEARRSTLLIYENCANDTTTASLHVINGSNNWMSMRENALNRTGIDTAQLIGAFFSGDEDWESLTTQEDIPLELPRSYALYVPTSYDPMTPTPVVVSLHGRGANHFSQAGSSGFNAVAEEHGFIVVYPQAYDPNFNNEQADAVWNYNLNTSLFTALPWDDDAFLDEVVDDIATMLNVDMNRLYVNGLSNGGYMTNRLACTRGDRYAAFAAVAANAPFGLTELCQDGVHAPIMFYHGTADTISPWDGSTVTHPNTGQTVYVLAPIPNTLAFWVEQNECGQDFEQVEVPSTDPDSNILFIRQTACPIDSAVEIYAVVNGGHVWHGVQDFENEFLGEVNMDLNASEAIWAFYSGYSLDGYDETTAIEFNIGDVVDGADIVAAENEQNQQAEFIATLQNGGFVLYFAMDLSPSENCDIDEGILTEVDGILDALNRLEIEVDLASIPSDCRANTVASRFTSNINFYEEENLETTLSTLPDSSRFGLVVGDIEQISEAIGQTVPENQSVLIQPSPDNSTYRAIAIVPMSGWTTLADIYDEILASQ